MSLIDLQPIVAPAIGEYDGYLQNYEALAVIGNDLAIAQQVVEIAANLSFPEIERSAKTTSSIFTHLPIVRHISHLFRIYYTHLVASYRLYSTMKQVLEHFGEQDTIVTPQLIVSGESIDLFIQFGRGKKARYYALMLRTKSRSRICWSDSRKVFIYKRLKDGKNWDWKSLTISTSKKLSTVESLKLVGQLSKQKSPLVPNKSIRLAKAIVLTDGTSLNPEANRDLVVNFGLTEGKVLKIQADGVFYVLESKDLIDFLSPPLPAPEQNTKEQEKVLSV
jgi:hypothetical protein